MSADTPLISTISLGLCLAFVFGILAKKLKVPPIIGYLLAGLMVGPYTGGFYADPELTHQLAEFGVVLLMFGIGLHFSWKDLVNVKKIAIPGAFLQMAFTSFIGGVFGWCMGWSFASNIVFGLALSTGSTVVVLRTLQDRYYMGSERGHIAMGWLVVEDICMVFALVLIPAIYNRIPQTTKLAKASKDVAHHVGTNFFTQHPVIFLIFLTIAKVLLFITLTLVFGRKIIPWILSTTAKTGSRELFRLSILAVALGLAFIASTLFGVSLALGAFFAGMIMGETDMSQRAAEESLPLRDAFAVLFFVSVGMLFNPYTIIKSFFPLTVTILIVTFGNGAATYGIMRLFGYSYKTSITLACCFAQIGEFAFILADLGSNLHIINNHAKDLIIGAAIISILINPLIFMLTTRIKKYYEEKHYKDQIDEDVITIPVDIIDENPLPQVIFENHTIIIGFGSIGLTLYQHLRKNKTEIAVISQDIRSFEEKDNDDETTIFIQGNGANNQLLNAANISKAKSVILTNDHIYENAQIIRSSREINKDIIIIATANKQSEAQYLTDEGADHVILNAEEITSKILQTLANQLNYNRNNKMITPI